MLERRQFEALDDFRRAPSHQGTIPGGDWESYGLEDALAVPAGGCEDTDEHWERSSKR